ncbi:MAG: DUF4411 family protein [Gammaproteobacteria bacterium]|nr:DUF4411 family protein [Gammaproteobacteria bacterium]
MHYVLDTGFFADSRVYYQDVFPGFWEKIKDAVNQDVISSVEEVRAELERYGGPQEHLLDWIKDHRNIFTQPSLAEQDKVRQILAVPEFQALVSSKNRLKGHPAADPFVIAKAWELGGSVVTTERKGSGNTPRIGIPYACEQFKVRCILPETFMEEMDWRF